MFVGSAIAAGITPFFPRLGIDFFAAVARPVHAITIAAAARATGKTMLAVPVRKSGKTGYVVTWPFRILQATDLVPGKAIVSLTGVSENIVVVGARYRYKKVASTQTLTLDAPSSDGADDQ